MASIELHLVGSGIFEAFKSLTTPETIWGGTVRRKLTSEEQRFRLWAHSLGLHRSGHASLDYRVRDAIAVKSRLADILSELKDQLENIVSIQKGERPPFGVNAPKDDSDAEEAEFGGAGVGSLPDSQSRSASPSLFGDSDTSFDEVELRLESMVEALDALYSLATKIKNPRNRPSRTTQELYKRVPADIRDDFIRDRERVAVEVVSYVQRQQLLESLKRDELDAANMSEEDILQQYASPASWLIRRTGLANARRKQQFLYWKEHAEMISGWPAGPTSHPTAADSPPQKDTVGNMAETGQQPATSVQQPDLRGPRPNLSLATSATRLNDDFVKLDDMSSVISHQSRVSTVMNIRGEKLEWPDPPRQTVGDAFFICPYCQIICPGSYLAKKKWCVHLINDLQPYHCTYEQCQDPHRIYGNRQDWMSHERLHTRVWHCGQHEVEFETQPEYVTHLEREHPNTGKAELVSPELLAAAAGPSARLHRDCPFCPTAFTEVAALERHITFHLERLAMLALPAAEDEGDESYEDDDRPDRSSDSQHIRRHGRAESVRRDFATEEEADGIPDKAYVRDRMAVFDEINAVDPRPIAQIRAAIDESTEGENDGDLGTVRGEWLDRLREAEGLTDREQVEKEWESDVRVRLRRRVENRDIQRIDTQVIDRSTWAPVHEHFPYKRPWEEEKGEGWLVGK